MESVPSEVLQAIFEAGCDLEFEELPLLEEHTRTRRRYFQGSISRSQRYLKHFLRPLLSVCKDWQALIEQSSTLWITTLYTASPREVPYFKPSQIFDKSNDDLVVSLSLGSCDESVDWFRTQILPYSHRLRKILINFVDPLCIPPIFTLLCRARFPRLLGLTLKFGADGNIDLGIDIPELWFPSVRSLNIARIPWSPTETCFRNLTGLELRENLSTFWSSAALMKFIQPSAHSLVTLTIHIPKVWPTSELSRFPLHLPRLSRLITDAPSIGCIVHILENISSPSLKTLIVRSPTLGAAGTVAAIQDMPVRELHFSSLKYIVIELMPVNCILPLFERLKAPNVEGLSLYVANYRPEDLVLLPVSGSTRFNKLQSLHIDWKSYVRGEDDVSSVAAFFNYFDFSQASDHVVVSLNTSTLKGQLDFPNLKKHSVVALQDLAHISAPALQHLYLPFADLRNERLWTDVCDSEDVPLESITTLQLGMMIFLEHIPNLEGKIFLPFAEVTTLLVTHFDNFMSSSDVEYSWPKCWQDYVYVGWSGTVGWGNVLFPKLNSLQVALPEDKVQESVLRKIIAEAGKFLQARKKQGYPVRTLSLNFIPPALSDLVAEISREVDEFRVVNYRHDEELRWLTTARIWPL